MARLARHLVLALSLALALAGGARGAAGEKDAMPTTVDLSAEVSRAAPNDMATAVVYAEASGRDPATLSRDVNAVVSSALARAKDYPGVKARTLGVNTYPVYGKEGRHIESWRMRSEIELESRDLAALSELLGKLQGELAISGLVMQPAPETRKNAADMAATDAIRAFETRAESIARALGKRYRIRHLAIGYGDGAPPPRPMLRAAPMAAEAAPLPMEGGESQVSVNVHGTIELLD